MVKAQSQGSAPVAHEDTRALPAIQGTHEIAKLLDKAIDKETPVEALEKLVTLYERIDEKRARAEFFSALRSFQDECPSIPKRRTAEIRRGDAIKFSYKFADLDDIDTISGPIAFKHGLSYTWDTEIENDKLTSIFILRHVGGHEERTRFTVPVGSSAGMSEQQKFASANTFAKRYSMIGGLGLTNVDPDDDGGGGTIDEEQIANLEAMLEEVRSITPPSRFLEYLKVSKIEDIKARDYDAAVAALEKKRQQMNSGGGGM